MAFSATPGPEGQADALTLLRADHERIRHLFAAFGRLRGDDEANERKAGLVDDLCHALRIHGMLEEDTFYPALRAVVVDDDMLAEAEEEHVGMYELVSQLAVMFPGDEHFEATVTVLAEEFAHHIALEESEMFDAAHAAGIDLASLGRRLLLRRRELEDELAPVPGMIDGIEPHEGMRSARRPPD